MQPKRTKKVMLKIFSLKLFLAIITDKKNNKKVKTDAIEKQNVDVVNFTKQRSDLTIRIKKMST